MTSPGPAFQECTESCHENVLAPKGVSSDLWLTDGLTILARIEIVAILVHYQQSYNISHACPLFEPSSCNYADKIPIDLFYLESAMDRSQYVVFAKKVTAFQPKLFWCGRQNDYRVARQRETWSIRIVVRSLLRGSALWIQSGSIRGWKVLLEEAAHCW